MSARNIADLLTEFDCRPRAAGRVLPFERHAAPPSSPAPSEDLEAKIEEAYQRGRQEGEAAAIAHREARLMDYAAHAAKKREEARERWTDEESTVIADLIRNRYDELESAVAESLARILEPFLTQMIRDQAVSAFVDHLRAALGDGARPVLKITGPADLLESIRHKLGAAAISLDYIVDESCDVRLVNDQAILETRIHAWIGRLQEAVR